MHTGFSGLSGRTQSSSYLSPRNRHSYADTSRLSGRPASPPYQPSKYGLPSDLSYNPTVGDGIYKNNFDDDVLNRESGFQRGSSYGYLAQEFDFGPYRSSAPRSTDYSSDTGGPYRSNVPHTPDYSSDSGRGHVSRHMTDYSSDSGLNSRHQRRKSDFELEIPSPIMSRKDRTGRSNEDLFSSPVKVPPSEYSRLKENIPSSSARHQDLGRNNHHGHASSDSPRNTMHDHHLPSDIKPESDHDHRNSIKSHEHSFEHEIPNHSLEHLHNTDNMHSHDTDHNPSHEGTTANHVNSHESDHLALNDNDHINTHDTSPKSNNHHPEESESRLDFMSPPLYRGRNVVDEQPRVTKKPPHKASDLTHWQQRHRSLDSHADDDQVSYIKPTTLRTAKTPSVPVSNTKLNI